MRWTTGDHPVVQVRGHDAASPWVSVPGAPLVGSALPLLLRPAGAIEADGAAEATGTVSALVELDEVVARTPSLPVNPRSTPAAPRP